MKPEISFSALVACSVGMFSPLVANGAVDHVFAPEAPVGLDRSIFAEDKVAYGHHLAEVLSDSFYASEGARLTLFKNGVSRNGNGNFKFKQEIAGLPVINGDIVLHTNAEGDIFYRRGPILPVTGQKRAIAAPSASFLVQLSSMLGGESLDQIEFDNFPLYWDWSTSSFDTFTGVFE